MLLHARMFLWLVLCTVAFCKNGRIIGGTDAQIERFPYHASLMRISDNQHICNGVIVSNLHVLTTAHCVDINVIVYSNLKIRIGLSRRTSLRGSVLLPDRVFTHPMYTKRANCKTHKLYDVAIIKTRQWIQFDELQNMLGLPLNNIVDNNIGVLSGWGSTNATSNTESETLKTTSMTIIDVDDCQSKVSFKIHLDQFCAFKSSEIGIGIGDGGSPLVSNNKVIGLVSSQPHESNVPDVFTNVFSHIDFIHYTLKR